MDRDWPYYAENEHNTKYLIFTFVDEFIYFHELTWTLTTTFLSREVKKTFTVNTWFCILIKYSAALPRAWTTILLRQLTGIGIMLFRIGLTNGDGFGGNGLHWTMNCASIKYERMVTIPRSITLFGFSTAIRCSKLLAMTSRKYAHMNFYRNYLT